MEISKHKVFEEEPLTGLINVGWVMNEFAIVFLASKAIKF
jgi:hypothetical protein